MTTATRHNINVPGILIPCSYPEQITYSTFIKDWSGVSVDEHVEHINEQLQETNLLIEQFQQSTNETDNRQDDEISELKQISNETDNRQDNEISKLKQISNTLQTDANDIRNRIVTLEAFKDSVLLVTENEFLDILVNDPKAEGLFLIYNPEDVISR